MVEKPGVTNNQTSGTASAVDYGEDTAPEFGDNILAQIDYLANETIDAEDHIATAQALLKVAQERFKDLKERQLPEALEKARQKKMLTASDLTVELKDVVRASLSEGKKPKGFAWLRENGHAALIKTELNVPFEAGRDVAALGLKTFLVMLAQSDQLRAAVRLEVLNIRGYSTEELNVFWEFMQAIGNEADERFELNSSVHAQTLGALVRELLSKGKADSTVLETLGAAVWKEAVVTRK